MADFHAAEHPRNSLPSYIISNRPQGLLFGWRLLLMGSWLNILMIFLPLSCILDIAHPKSRGLVFIFSVLSLVPLVKFHDVSTRELAIRIGGSKTGLVNASLSNMVEIVVAISALRKCELRVVQSSLIGSMLSKLLLVLGLCLFAGGIRFSEQGFNPAMHSSLLSLSVGAVLLPAAYHFALGGVHNSRIASQLQMQNILSMSHGVSIILLFSAPFLRFPLWVVTSPPVYGSYLFFQLYSHTHLYKDQNRRDGRRTSGLHRDAFHNRYPAGPHASLAASPSALSPPRNIYLASHAAYSTSEATLVVVDQLGRGEAEAGFTGLQMSRGRSDSSNESNGSDFLGEKRSAEGQNIPRDGNETQDERKPQLSMFLIVVLLVLVTVWRITADRLVESMDSIASTIQKPYVALIILPAVSSIAECMTAVNVSVKDELNFAISVAVGSTIQTALFVIPFMVTLAWAIGKPLALLFDPFESLVLYISVQVMTYVTGDGKSNYLEGIVLLCLYIIIAVSFWFYPGDMESIQLNGSL
ncbi:Sodium/calcium exchanger protein-domain-containing protein [Mycena filopes]|nr:Sodium/calcium exchanger protein-domain-containing protein [Mycena filopes]